MSMTLHNEFPLRAFYRTKPAKLLLQAKTLIPCSTVNCLRSPHQSRACIRETTAKYYRTCPAASLLLQLTCFSSGLILPGNNTRHLWAAQVQPNISPLHARRAKGILHFFEALHKSSLFFSQCLFFPFLTILLTKRHGRSCYRASI